MNQALPSIHCCVAWGATGGEKSYFERCPTCDSTIYWLDVPPPGWRCCNCPFPGDNPETPWAIVPSTLARTNVFIRIDGSNKWQVEQIPLSLVLAIQNRGKQ